MTYLISLSSQPPGSIRRLIYYPGEKGNYPVIPGGEFQTITIPNNADPG